MNVSLQSLIKKLDGACRGALEGAAGLCLSRGNYDVDIEHLFLKLLDAPGGETAAILRSYGVDSARLNHDLMVALDQLKTGNTRTPALSPRVVRLLEEAWLLASVDYGATRISPGHLLASMLGVDDLTRIARDISKEFSAISIEALRRDLPRFTATIEGASSDGLGGVNNGAQLASGGKALDQYTIDLTARARAGEIDPVLGRDFEVRQVIDILTRRRQNNPILTGEAGVGKTAIVEGFALRIAAGDVPDPLKNVAVRTLDLGLLQAGAGIKGEFENRLKSVIDEVKASPRPTILFIDEAHTMIGAGGQAGQNDAANLLKPALARGELRTIAATTWAEYKKYFEKDAALARRFQVVKVEEPDEAQAVMMLRGLTAALEKHHRVRILEEAVEDAVKLSHRYITGRQLPDKAVSVLDTACARVAIGYAATPAPLEDAQRRINQLEVERGALEREEIAAGGHRKRIDELTVARDYEAERLKRLKAQWDREREVIGKIQELRARLEELAGKDADGA
ncbi:MAG TPA: AAA family ATPase, partial [Candidatus Binataceae bacterium]|nr:AAA family ATPase [Candidatus Binataceae bacterium]